MIVDDVNERTPLLPLNQDIEQGQAHHLHTHLSVGETCDRIERCIKERKINNLHRLSKCLFLTTKYSFWPCVASVLVLYTTWWVLREEHESNDATLKDTGAAVFIGGLACMTCAIFQAVYHCILNNADKKQVRLKDQLQKKISKINYYKSVSDPLSGEDFCRAYKDLNPEQIHKLSVRQISEIQSVSQNVFQSLFRKLSSEQKEVWNLLDEIKAANMTELTLFLDRDSVKNNIILKPGFFEELIKILPEAALDDPQLKNLLVRFSRHFIDNCLDEETALKQVQLIRQGYRLESCFRVAVGDDRVTIKSHSGKSSLSVPVDILVADSPYFRSLFQGRADGEGPSRWMESDADEITIEGISEEGFNLFIDFLRGRSPVITEQTCLEVLEMASYFRLNRLALQCEPCLIDLMENKSIEENFSLLNRFPLLSPPFVDYVDSRFKKSLKYNSILKKQEDFMQATETARHYNLTQSKNELIKILKDKIRCWTSDNIPRQSFKDFMYAGQIYEGLSLNFNHKPLHEAFANAIRKRLKHHNKELPVLVEGPHFVDALISFFQNDANFDLINQYFDDPIRQLNCLKRIRLDRNDVRT